MRNRAIFTARHRLGDLCVQLQNHGMFLDGFDQTYIISELPTSWYQPLLKQYGVDTDKLIFVNDEKIYSRYKNIKQFAGMHPWMGGWIQQQILKLSVLDSFEFDTLTIQDPDTFWIQPWHHFDNNQPVMLIWPNHNESPEYYALLERLTGITRQTPHCLVTEFMTVTKNDWQSFKDVIEQRSGTNWIDAIAQNLRPDANNQIWISEYELLGNWIIHQRSPTLIDQKRLEFKTLNDINQISKDICVLSNQTHELFWANENNNCWTVDNFSNWQKIFPAYS